jgi:RNA polymerase sigma factor (sigma-70 family)
MSDTGEKTRVIRTWIERLQAGDENARAELLRHAEQRLLHLTRKMKEGFARVGRWEQTEDVYQNANLRLWKALEVVAIHDVRHFFRLAAQQIRRELIDLSRSHAGPVGGVGHLQSHKPAAHETDRTVPLWDPADLTRDPRQMAEWTELHKNIERLPDEQREVVDLLWYHGLTQEEAADALGVSVRQIKRIWRGARIQLFDWMEGKAPGE